MEDLRCPQCGAPHAAQQSFCGDCGYAFHAGVTRPLPASAARVASGADPMRRVREAPPYQRLVAQGVPLLIGLVVIVLGLLWLRSRAEANPASVPGAIVELQPGKAVELRPGVLLTLTQAYVAPSPTHCGSANLIAFWDFALANSSATAATVVLDDQHMRHTDSLGTSDLIALSGDCGVTFLYSFPGPLTIAPGKQTQGAISYPLKEVSAAASYVELQVMLSGTPLHCRLPLP